MNMSSYPHPLQARPKFVTISGMKVLGQKGSLNALLIPFILLVLVLIVALGFGYWAYTSRQDYKNNAEKKIAAAVTIAKQQESTTKDNEFVQQEKLPLRTYTGPSAFGSLTVQYPKTWSAYVAETDTSSTVLDGYFEPSVVPSILGGVNSFALRVQLVGQTYSDVMLQYTGLATSQKVTVSPYTLPKVASIIGSRINGQIQPNKSGSMIVLPVRDKTLEVWTEDSQYLSDFNNNILPNISFSP